MNLHQYLAEFPNTPTGEAKLLCWEAWRELESELIYCTPLGIPKPSDQRIAEINFAGRVLRRAAEHLSGVHI